MTPERRLRPALSRRRFLSASALGAAGLALDVGRRPGWAQGTAPPVITPDAARPQTPSGVMTGDITADRAVIWSRTDRPARLLAEYALRAPLRKPSLVVSPGARAARGLTP